MNFAEVRPVSLSVEPFVELSAAIERGDLAGAAYALDVMARGHSMLREAVEQGRYGARASRNRALSALVDQRKAA